MFLIKMATIFYQDFKHKCLKLCATVEEASVLVGNASHCFLKVNLTNLYGFVGNVSTHIFMKVANNTAVYLKIIANLCTICIKRGFEDISLRWYFGRIGYGSSLP